MTKKLFWEDAYIKEFDATITSVDGNQVQLDQTAFNPRGGGLISDVGELNGVKVLETIKGGNDDVLHNLESNSFSVGEKVHGKIDWEKRYNIMRMHTAAHLISSIFNAELGLLITGNQISFDESRMDFNLENFDKGKILELIEKSNRIISEGHQVKTYFLPREEAMKIPNVVKLAGATPPEVSTLRIVEIEGVDIQADGGVHVGNTKEIGKVVVMKMGNKGKNNRRLYYTVE